MKNSILLTIPLRFKSERFPNKLLFNFKGKAIIEYVINLVRSLKYDYIFLTNEDDSLRLKSFLRDDEKIYCCENESSIESATDRIGEYVIKNNINKFIVKIPADEFLLEKNEVEYFINKSYESEDSINMAYTEFYCEEDLKSNSSAKVILNKNKLIYLTRSQINYAKKNIALNSADSYHFAYYRICKVDGLYKKEKLEEIKWIEMGYSPRCINLNHKYFGIDTFDQIEILENRYGN
jgi:CMP-2-keto-3-deoxyoctulosonic acid synthetase